jgi:hypothetical protein
MIPLTTAILLTILIWLYIRPIREGMPGLEFVTREIDSLKSAIMKPVTVVENYLITLKDILEDIGTLMSEGVTLLETSTSLLQSVAQLMYLIVTKLQMCFYGSKEVYNRLKIELDQTNKELQTLINQTKQCSRLDQILIGTHNDINMSNYVDKCMYNWDQTINKITTLTERYKQILLNAQLFAMQQETQYGKDKNWCKKNFKMGASFSYGKQCNQCLNFDGMFSKGLKELDDVVLLVKTSLAFKNAAMDLTKKIHKL